MDDEKLDRIIEMVSRLREDIAEFRGARLFERLDRLEARERKLAIRGGRSDLRGAILWAGASSGVTLGIGALLKKLGII